MEDLPVPLLAEIIMRIPSTRDLNSLSLVSKRLYTVEAGHRNAIFIGSGLCPRTPAMSSLCSRFPNLRKVQISYDGWTPDYGVQLDNQGLHVLSSSCLLLNDLTLVHCSNIDDAGFSYIACCKKLISLRLHNMPGISSSGLLSVAIGCKTLSTLYLNKCKNVSGTEWLEYFGRNGSLEELVLILCKRISQYDLLKFGPGWMRLQRFEFEGKRNYIFYEPCVSSHMSHYHYKYDFCCESLKSLRLAHIIIQEETGLRFLLGKCRALERLCLHLVNGLKDCDMVAVSQSCSNLRSIKLVLMPLKCRPRSTFSTSFTDDSLKALALGCPKLEDVDLAFGGCDPCWPSEIVFTQEGLLMLIQSCPIRVFVLTGANFFNDVGMAALSYMLFLETLDLMDCVAVTDAGIHSIAGTPRLVITLRECNHITDGGLTKLAHDKKLESLTISGCPKISQHAIQGVATSVHYSVESPRYIALGRF
ncbi:unnamed protein product [Urochloa decumbens]|uniref:F-box/LRR-repeat protein 15-like leucin rich repeat domain-containing protein n=1 Tax=Urochloa decumbens TaxID=240449 RepID=A0ABC9GEA4_9POAL